ncbi:ABC transporter permease [Catalinimonas niigatensis]|uniref:ABC transporter permease n=1 Tax=Catalinimonas niigatensis TaxID=1397264 RepID=UPI0026660675|nr:ABC transporter permease [Catalinimonas niigatensis]WPP48827.1 ABC transporter permease [Catalinimonas niigatensis]
MLSNYLKITIRNMRRHTFFAMLNISGLAVGMAGFLLIVLYVFHELSYDRFFPNDSRIYRITTFTKGEQDVMHYATSPMPLAPAMQEEIPEVEAITRVMKWNDFTIRLEGAEDKKFKEADVYYAEQSFFNVLGYNLLAGDPNTALASEALVLTQETARRYFGKEAETPEKLIGKTLLVGGKNANLFPITGIVENPPVQTHFHFDILISTPNNEFFGFHTQEWTFTALHTYALINEAAAQDSQIAEKIEQKLTTFLPKYVLPSIQMSIEKYQQSGYAFDFHLQPLTDIHLHSQLIKEHEANGNITYVYIFSVVALFILVLACVNFINLSTARAAQRTKEVGVRKVMGAAQPSLIRQFLLESISYSLIATLIALGMVELLRIPFQQFTGRTLTLSLLDIPYLPLGLVIVVLGMGLLAGSYPAFYLSSFQPQHVLKGQAVGRGKQGFHQYLRSGLVVFQFSISVVLIICTMLIYQQLQYIQSKSLGFDRENVIVIHNDRDMTNNMENFTVALKEQASIQDVSFTTLLPAYGESQMRVIQTENSDFQYDNIKWFQADEHYASTLDLELVDGRWFSKDFASDTAAIILNEAAVKTMGLQEPVGKFLWMNKGEEDEKYLKIIAVVKDYHYESFDQTIKPFVVELLRPASSFRRDYIAVRTAPGDVQQSIGAIEAQWKAFAPNIPMVYSFLDADFDHMFRAEQRMGTVFTAFSSLAIFIACLGLLGLAAFTAEKRTREIGIRKVLGASVAGVVALLSTDFMKLMLIALLIAMPLAYVAMQQWLQNFAYRTNIEVWVFVAAGLGALLLALLTVGYQTLKAALANPVDSLRNE